MIQSILLTLLIVALIYTIKHIKRLPPERRKKFTLKVIIYGGALLLLLLVATGRLHWVAAGFAAILPLAQRLFFFAMRVLPFVKHWQGRQQQAHYQQANSSTNSNMDVKQAKEILGIDKLESAEQVSKRHKELMQKMHPDRGGSDYLASQINEAKAVLIKHLKA